MLWNTQISIVRLIQTVQELKENSHKIVSKIDDSASNSDDIGLRELLDGTNGAFQRCIEMEDKVGLEVMTKEV
jgi:hypothetical protein